MPPSASGARPIRVGQGEKCSDSRRSDQLGGFRRERRPVRSHEGPTGHAHGCSQEELGRSFGGAVLGLA